MAEQDDAVRSATTVESADTISASAATIGKTEQEWKLRGNPVSDQSTADDKLGFLPYVDAVAAFLLHPDTRPPLTMSVEGEWGTGKSSFMRQLKAKLEKSPSAAAAAPALGMQEGAAAPEQSMDTRPMTFWFNAWRHDKQDDMWAAFALGITKHVRSENGLGVRFWGDLKLAVSRLETLGAWVHTAAVFLLWLLFGGALAALIAYLFNANQDTRTKVTGALGSYLSLSDSKSVGDLVQGAIAPIFAQMNATHYWLAVALFLVPFYFWFRQHLGKRLDWKLAEYLDKPDYKKRSAFIESFHKDFKRVIAAYAAKRRVFIFVDDLDRCDVPRAAELMQAINLMIGDDDHLIFILGMDREKIAAGITLKYKDLIPFLEVPRDAALTARHPSAFGYSYLEKFIQITFRVPRPSESGIADFLNSIGQNQADLKQEVQQRWAEESVRRERRKNVEVRARADSDEVAQQVKLVAPVLDWNPRRIKQFINDFRLQAYIASDLGLLDLVAADDTQAQSARITLEQLGKFVAITLAWPDLVMDLIGFPDLLTAIYQNSLESDGGAESQDEQLLLTPRQLDLVKRWSQEVTLVDLLFAIGGSDPNSKYSLSGTDLRVLLNIAPRVNRNAAPNTIPPEEQPPFRPRPTARQAPPPDSPDEGQSEDYDYDLNEVTEDAREATPSDRAPAAGVRRRRVKSSKKK